MDKSPKKVQAESIPNELDEKAFAESSLIADERLGAHRRQESVRDHVHWATLFGFWSLVTLVAVIGITWAYHLVTPDGYHFLSDEQLETQRTILLAAIGSSYATSMSRQLIANDKRS